MTSPCAPRTWSCSPRARDDDVSHLEVYVYEAVLNGSEEANLYCHHDLLLPAFSLSLAWMDCPADGGREGAGQLCRRRDDVP